MKKETILTAVTAAVFLVVGFLAGYVYHAQHAAASADVSPSARSAASAPAAAPAPASEATSLPEGHPPIDTAALAKGLEEEVQRDPNNPKPLLSLANFYYDQREFQQAIESYERALKLDPRNVNARTDLGTAYYNLGRPDEALAEYRKSLEIDPTHEPTMFNLIIVNLEGTHDVALEGTHDVAAARAAWEKLHRRNPNYRGLEALRGPLGLGGNSQSSSPR